MNHRQEQFCQQYMIDSNGKRAAIHVGYSEKTAAAQASRLLTNVNVRKRIDELFVEHRKQVDISIESLTDMLRDDRQLAHDNAQAGAAVSATDKLARLHGLMTDRLKVDVTGSAESMSEAEREAELNKCSREMVSYCGRPYIEEKITFWRALLVEFDGGVFDDDLPRGVSRSDDQDGFEARMAAARPALPAPPAAAVVVGGDFQEIPRNGGN